MSRIIKDVVDMKQHLQEEEELYHIFHRLSTIEKKKHMHESLIGLHGDNIKVLLSPSEFYDRIIAGIEKAEERITLCSLYLGTDTLEKKLVTCLQKRLQENPNLQLSILLDHSRGQRRNKQGISSISILLPLLQNFGPRVHFHLYQVPVLERSIPSMLPPPWNETMGVSHIKAYVFDNTLIMSGANLSTDYFTDRQDRYIEFNDCPELSMFYHRLVDILKPYSWNIQHKARNKDKDNFKLVRQKEKNTKQLAEHLLQISENVHQISTPVISNPDTWVFPLFQFSPIGVRQDEYVVSKLMLELPKKTETIIASGYLNFPEFISTKITQSQSQINVITASPKANGFYDAEGIKGSIPMAYSLIEKDFYNKSIKMSINSTKDTTRIYEFIRPNWTFHAKGLWVRKKESNPSLTIVGSSNFGRRSYERDLESQLMLYTKNYCLQKQLMGECEALLNQSELVTETTWQRMDRKLHGLGWKQGHWIRPVARFISSFF